MSSKYMAKLVIAISKWRPDASIDVIEEMILKFFRWLDQSMSIEAIYAYYSNMDPTFEWYIAKALNAHHELALKAYEEVRAAQVAAEPAAGSVAELAVKSATGPAAEPAAVFVAELAVKSATGPAAEHWPCYSCTFNNHVQKNVCEVCQTQRPSAFCEKPTRSHESWICRTCTLENHLATAKCSVCDTDR